MAPLLMSLTSNDCTIKSLFSFSEEVPSFDCAHHMTSFNRVSVYQYSIRVNYQRLY